jgi:ABC-type dipeptide/oligopeptide/nickel transport system ATPase component
MKEGKIVESGTHKELIKIPDGEYKKLYDIQASPFRDEDEPLRSTGTEVTTTAPANGIAA